MLQQANEIRAATARTWEGLDRWREISLSLFDELQPVFVQTSMDLANSGNKTLARDNLYKEIRIVRLRKLREMQADRVFVAYTSMYRFNPSIRPYFETIANELRAIDLEMLDSVLGETEANVLSADDKTKVTAFLGNKLRASANKIKEHYEARIRAVLASPERFLNNLIMLPDAKLLEPANLNAPQ